MSTMQREYDRSHDREIDREIDRDIPASSRPGATNPSSRLHRTTHPANGASLPALVRRRLDVSSPGDASEREADRAADAMVRGASFAIGAATPAVMREADPKAKADPPPVGFGEAPPETYEPDFFKDSVPGVETVIRALAAVYGWMSVLHAAREASRQHTIQGVLDVLIRAGLMGGLLRGDVTAEVLPQSWLIALAQREVSSKGPLARQHLDHYLAGSGSNFVEDVARLYAQDSGFRAATERLIAQGSSLEGVGSLRQEDFSNEEWQYALGSVDEVHYKVLRRVDDDHAEVSIRLRDPYEWHPDEYRGWGSHVAHVALERAKENGAKNYWEVGEATIELRVGKSIVQKLG